MSFLKTSFLLLAGLAGCTAIDMPTSTGPEGGERLSFEQFLSQKNDTGYVGNKASELEITATGTVRVLLDAAGPDELEALAEAIRANPTDQAHRDITRAVSDQLKFARNALKGRRLNLNLEGGEPAITAVDVIDGGLDLSYSVRIESLIKLMDLGQGQRLEDFVGLEITADLPMRIDGLKDRATGCWEDIDNGQPPPAADLNDWNLFYYWKPSRQGCVLRGDDLSTATLRVTSSSASAPTVYPEYDRLVEDGRVTMTAVFGQMTHGQLRDSDSGFYFYEAFVKTWTDQGYERVGAIDTNLGETLRKTVTNGDQTLTIEIDVYNPRGFADTVPSTESNQRFKNAIANREIVFYGGHSFYGSLNILREADAYSPGYQVFFMDSCWSYEYYTKQVFRNKATAQDPTGYLDADVVNNTEAGSNDDPSLVLWDTFMKGVTAHFMGNDVTPYSWNTMIEYMNNEARWSGELFGASGVRNNVYQPGQNGEAPPSDGDEPRPPGEGDGYYGYDVDGDGIPD